MTFLDSVLDNLDLLRDGRELHLEETVELIEAAPSTALDQTDEDATHRLVVKTFVTVENEDLATKGLPKSLHGLCLACAGGTVWVATIAKLHSHDEGQEALV